MTDPPITHVGCWRPTWIASDTSTRRTRAPSPPPPRRAWTGAAGRHGMGGTQAASGKGRLNFLYSLLAFAFDGFARGLNSAISHCILKFVGAARTRDVRGSGRLIGVASLHHLKVRSSDIF